MAGKMVAAVAILLSLLTAAERAEARVTKGRINKTGQNVDFGPGSDGDLQRGLSRIFNDLGNGVVKDARTGLFWEKKSDDGSIHDKDNTYTWGQVVVPFSMNGSMVKTFLEALNTPPCHGGYCDWRVPNMNELLSIVNWNGSGPVAFPEFNTNCTAGCSVTACSCTGSGGFPYWSSSTRPGVPDFAYFVGFGTGSVGSNGKETPSFVRAVRGGP